ncbi:MAG: CDP-diacylglycerol--glycerol-3-phosphate 3-phosphatidyltransferase [Candidatus Omnitrophota bacterium]
MKNLPNILTTVRIGLTLVFLALIYKAGFEVKFAACMIYLVAAITDYFDGYFARKYKVESNYGKIMDPIADKFLVLAGFLVFMQLGDIALWMLVVIAAREVLLTLVRFFALGKGMCLAAESAGKYKTFLQMGTIAFGQIIILIEEYTGGVITTNTGQLNSFWYNGFFILMICTVLITLYSGYQFLKNNWGVLFGGQVNC